MKDKKNRDRVVTAGAVMIRLDKESHDRLLRAKHNSGRSKTNEATLRLRDHLERFPDFYSSEHTDNIINKS